MVKYRKGELKFYKKLLPHELNEYINEHPENTEYIKKFLQNYKFNYRQNKWKKGGVGYD